MIAVLNMCVFLITFGNNELPLLTATPDHNNGILKQRRDRNHAELEAIYYLLEIPSTDTLLVGNTAGL